MENDNKGVLSVLRESLDNGQIYSRELPEGVEI